MHYDTIIQCVLKIHIFNIDIKLNDIINQKIGGVIRKLEELFLLSRIMLWFLVKKIFNQNFNINLYIKKLKKEHFTSAFWLQNNLCKITKH